MKATQKNDGCREAHQTPRTIRGPVTTKAKYRPLSIVVGLVVLVAMVFIMPASADHGGLWHTTCAPNADCALFTEEGNQQCSLEQTLFGEDLDEDGTKDCEDRDDDGDYLTDEYEFKWSATGYNSRRANSDFHGATDQFDMNPSEIRSLVSFEAQDFSEKKAGVINCDSGDNVDPYIPSGEFKINIGASGDIPLLIPTTWSLETHRDDRGNGKPTDLIFNGESSFFAAGQLEVPDFINDWSFTDMGVPSIKLTVGMRDHDWGSPNERAHLGGPGDKFVVEVNLDLDNPDLGVYTGVGGADRCNVSLSVKITDDMPWRAIHTAIFAKNNPGTFIGLEQIP